MLELTPEQVALILNHARQEAPLEACGLLAGRGGRVERVYLMRNAEHSPVAYRLDPEEQYRVFTELEGSGLELTAIFHSHPTGPACPSVTDLRLAYYPDVVYVIISLADPSQPEVRAFRILEGQALEEEIRIGPVSTM